MSTMYTGSTGTTLRPEEQTSGRHPVNVGHLVMGVAFLAFVGVWALIQTEVVGGGDVRWLLPVPWVLGGLAGLTAIALSGSRRRTRATGWVTPAGSAGPGSASDDEAAGSEQEQQLP